MTIIESIVQFLNQYEKEKIGVDKLGSSTMSYSLMKEPQEKVQRFISGLEVHTDYYQLAARRDAASEADRIANNAWGQGIAEWISQREQAGEYPALDGYVCTGIGISTPFYFGASDNGSAVSQVTIKIEYRKEKSR